MNIAELHKRLIAAARANPPGDRVPYAFEKRVMARLAALPAVDEWAFWSHALWRAVAPCVMVALLLGAWTYFAQRSDTASVDLSQDFDNTLLVAVDNANNYSW